MSEDNLSEENRISNSIYIDPAYCDSQVSYKINRTKYKDKESINASVLLSDCSRRIDWYFNDDDKSVAKIDKAITMLREFRKHLIKELNQLGGK